jgi:hypothetical protein
MLRCYIRKILRNQLRGLKSRAETSANGHKLTSIEDETLPKRMLDADIRTFPVQPDFVRRIAPFSCFPHLQEILARVLIRNRYLNLSDYPEVNRFIWKMWQLRKNQERPKVIKHGLRPHQNRPRAVVCI